MVGGRRSPDNCTIQSLSARFSRKSDRDRSQVEGTIRREWRLFRFSARRGGGDDRRAEPRRRVPSLAGGSLARNERSTLQSLESAFRVNYVSLRNSVGRISRTYRRVPTSRNCAIVPARPSSPPVGHARALTVAFVWRETTCWSPCLFTRCQRRLGGDSPTADQHIAAGRVQ